jgi:hypothetical protein
MNPSENVVSIHPYFKVHPGKLDAVKALLPVFIRKTATEIKNLYYGFSINDDELFCREAYVGAEGLLAHLENVGPELREMLTMADVMRVEVHGPAPELEKLRGPLADLNPVWFIWLGGVDK